MKEQIGKKKKRDGRSFRGGSEMRCAVYTHTAEGGCWGETAMPSVRVPKTERIRRPQQCKSIKGFYCQLEPGLPSHPAQWSLDESREPRFTAVFISLEQRQGVGKGWLAAGVSWYLLIGQSSSLWLARVIISLIGQSYHPLKPWKHDSGIIFGLVHLSEPVMALVRL